MVNKWLNNSLFQLFPTQCLVCGDNALQRNLCQHCKQDLALNQHACPRCAEPLQHSDQQSLCGQCLKKSPNFNQILSPYLYQPPIDRLITRFKFHADHSAGLLLAQLLGQYLESHIQQWPECLIPVPLHISRLRQRGFNQSMEFCRVLAKQFAIPVQPNLCVRLRNTSSQSGLNKKQRQQNIRGAFKIAEKLPYRHVAIVDDVITTGNTVNELAGVLRKAGAETIQVWSVCRATNLKA